MNLDLHPIDAGMEEVRLRNGDTQDSSNAIAVGSVFTIIVFASGEEETGHGGEQGGVTARVGEHEAEHVVDLDDDVDDAEDDKPDVKDINGNLASDVGCCGVMGVHC